MKFDATRITYLSSDHRAKYAAKNERVAAALNSGMRFAAVLIGHKGGRLDTAPAVIVLADGRVWAYSVFAYASALPLSEIKNDAWNSQANFEGFLRQIFGSQFAGAVVGYHLPDDRRRAIAEGKKMAASKISYAESWGVAIRVDRANELTRTAVWRCEQDDDTENDLHEEYEDLLSKYPHRVAVLFGEEAEAAEGEIWGNTVDRGVTWPMIEKALSLLDKMEELYVQSQEKSS